MANVNLIPPCVPVIVAVDGMKQHYGRYGAISAFLSPSQKDFRDQLDPMQACNGTKVSVNSLGQVYVKVQFDPYVEIEAAGNTLTCGIPAPYAQLAIETEYIIDTIKELGITFTAPEWNRICCGVEEFYLKNSSNIKFGSVTSLMSQLEVLGQVKRKFASRIDADLLAIIEGDAVSAIIAGTGINPVTGTAAPVTINLINAQGQLTENLNALAQQIQAKMNYCPGKWILLTGTGSKIGAYFQRCGISCCNTAMGINPEAILAKSSSYFDWYQSNQIDTLVGANSAFLIAPNSIAAHFLENFMELTEHGIRQWQNTHYDTIKIDGSYCDADVCVNEADYSSMEFGLRVRELGCIEGYVHPAMAVTLDTKYGFFTKPSGAHYNYGPFKDFTGIIPLTFS